MSDRNEGIPELNPGEDYHVFISHSSKQADYVENTLRKELTDLGFKCCNVSEDFRGGASVPENICTHINRSRKVMLLLSKEFMESQWTNFEIAEALYKEADTKKVTIIPVLYKMAIEDIPSDMYIKKVNILEWNDKHFLSRLTVALKEDISTEFVIAGDAADGLAWSYFYGYLKMVLPGMLKRVKDKTFEFPDPEKVKDIKYRSIEDIRGKRILPKMMIILPDSGFCPPSLTQDDENITHVCHIPYKASRAGNIGRDYKSSLYSVKNKNGEEILVIAEFATPLMSLYEMEVEGVSGLNKSMKLNQKLKFEQILQKILSIDKYDSCKGAYCFFSFKDPRTEEMKPDGWSLSEMMYNRARNELDIMDKIKAEKLKLKES